MDSKKFMSNSFIYLMSSILTQIINLILIPIYTRNMTSEDFGQFNLVSSLQSFLTIFITLCIYSGLSRFFNEVEDKNKLKNTALNFSIIWGALCCFIFAYLFKKPIAELAFKGDSLGSYYVKYVIINSVICCLITIYTSYYSMLFKAIKVSIINLSQILLTLCFTYYYLVLDHYGILGVYKAQFISFSTVFTALFILDIKNYRVVLSKNPLKKMLRFGIGLIPGQISAWILTLIDRYFIKGMLNLTAVAVYSMGYKIGMIIQPLLLTPFASSFTPFKFSVYKDPDGKERIKKIYDYFNFIGWFIVLGLSVFADTAIKLLSTKEYSESYKVVALIAFSYYLCGLSEFYILGLLIENKMFMNSFVITIGAVFNVIFNFLLIPLFGIYGAAAATCMAYFIADILYYIIGKKYYNLGISFLDPYKYSGIFLLLYFIYIIFKFNISNIVLEFFLSTILCISFIPLCVKFKIISYDSFQQLMGRYYLKIYLYKTNKLKGHSCVHHRFSIKMLDLEKLDIIRSTYAAEMDESKYEILKERLNSSGETTFIVCENEEICGYFNLAYRDVRESATGAVIKVPGDSIYLFDDYTFIKHRGKGVHEYSIGCRLRAGSLDGRRYAYTAIYSYNIISKMSYGKFSFKRIKSYNYFSIGKIKKIYERVIIK